MAETVTSPSHVVVIGAGIVGLSTAWYLQERGVQVTVLDRTGVAAGASWGNAGWIAPALTLPLPDPAIFRFGLKALLSPESPVYIPLSFDPRLLRFLAGFAWYSTPPRWRANMAIFAELNVLGVGAFDELADGGVAERAIVADPFLTGFVQERDRQLLEHEFAEIASRGGTVDFECLTGDELRGIEPSISHNVTHGIRIAGQRYIHPPLYAASLAEAVRSRGGDIRSGVTVIGIHDRDRGVELLTDTLTTAGESETATVTADQVVVATGSWIGALAAPFGVRALVQAGRGYSFSVAPAVPPTHPIYFPAQRVACTPLGDRLRVGGMMEFRSADAPLDPRRITTMVDAARPMFDDVDWDDRQDEWVGSRPCTADGLPLIGATRSPRVHVAGGHGMWGVTLGPLTGRLLADAITGRSRHPLLRHFDPLR